MNPAARHAPVGDVAASNDWLAIVGGLHVLAGRRATEDEGLHRHKIGRSGTSWRGRRMTGEFACAAAPEPP